MKVYSYNFKFILLSGLFSIMSLSLMGQNDVSLTLTPGPDNPRNSEGDFIELNDGRLLFVYTHYYGESGGDHSPAYLAGRYSHDNGKTWSRNDVTILENEGQMNVMSVSLVRLQNGNIAMFYMRKNSTSDGIPQMRISSDEAKTWSDPTPVIQDKEGYFVLNNDRVVQLPGGRLLVPVSRHNTPDTEWSNRGSIFCYYSDDNGQTWQSSDEVPNPENVMVQEPGVVSLQNGHIMMFMRTDEDVQYLAYSEDNGQTWSEVEPSNWHSPRSPASIERIPSTGDLVMVWNNNLARDKENSQLRTPLNIAISKNDGKYWKNIKTLADEPDGWYCYTSIHFTGDEILLGHCAGNRPAGTGLAVTQIRRVGLGWLYK